MTDILSCDFGFVLVEIKGYIEMLLLEKKSMYLKGYRNNNNFKHKILGLFLSEIEKEELNK